MASYSVNEAGLAFARELIAKRQYVLDSEWGAVQPKAAVETAYLDRNEYQTHLKPDPQLISSLRLTPGKVIPRWNYTIRPNL